MCLATAYKRSQPDLPLLQEIAHVHIKGDNVELESLFGDNKVIKGRLAEIDFTASKIIID